MHALRSRTSSVADWLSARRHHHLIAGILVLAVVVALRIPGLTSPLGIDEGGMTLIGAEWLRSATSGDGAGASLYGNLWIDRPPVILALYGLAELVGGELGVRVIGLFAALATAALAGTIASRIVGRRAWGPTALIAGVLLCSPAIDGDRTAGELLAAVPAAISVALLAAVALRDRRERDAIHTPRRVVFSRGSLLVYAGIAAATAPLVKQSALDAGVAAAVWFAWRAWDERRVQRAWRRLVADVALFGAGCIAALSITVGLAMRTGTSASDLAYALIGFRVDVLEALTTGATKSPDERIGRLLQPALGSGLLIVAVVAAFGLVVASRSRLHGAGVALLAGWLLGAVIGVSGGGYYWAHYLIQTAPPVAAAAGVALAHRNRAWTGGLVAILVLAAGVGQLVRSFDVPPERLVRAGYRPTSQQTALVIGDAVRRNSAPDDRIAVLYARANIAYYAQREPATPYLWSSMYRALPQARAELLTALTGPERTAWVVEWQSPRSFGMDEDGKVRAALTAGYREVAMLCGKPLLLRSDRTLSGFVLPPERCERPGPDRVTGARAVTRGFRDA